MDNRDSKLDAINAINGDRADADFWDDFILESANPAQAEAITATGNIVPVSAGAGTGKTWVLSRRFARLLLTDPEHALQPRDILTLTYTNAAADEMKERIEKQIKELISSVRQKAKIPLLPEREKIITDFSDSWVSTIHSFAKRLLGESGLSLDVDPHSEVISDEQSENFWNDVGNFLELGSMATLVRAYAIENHRLLDEAKALDTDSTLTEAVGLWTADALSKVARNAAELHASNGASWRDMRAWGLAASGPGLEDKLLLGTRNEVRAGLVSAWREAWDTWTEIFCGMGGEILSQAADAEAGSAKALLGELYSRWADKMGALSYAQAKNVKAPDSEMLRRFYLEVTDKSVVSSPRGKYSDSLKQYLDGLTVSKWQNSQEKLVKASQVLDGDLPEPERQMRGVLLRFCALCWALWDSMKRKHSMMTFADMIVNARKALELGSVDRKFRHILVDEFQDTDRLQFDMIQLMANASADSDSRTSLFAVGDPKQSIYSFRHARPELFANLMTSCNTGSSGSGLSLDVSFRTRAVLLERLNQLFKFIWPEGIGSSETMRAVPFEGLTTPTGATDEIPERDKGTVPPFRVILSDKASGNGGTEIARKQLARALARQCREWVESGLTIWSKREGRIRKLQYGDITVLVRKRNIYELLEDEFKSEGINAEEDLSRQFFTRSEIGDVVALLRAASDPNDDTALAGWLVSPLASSWVSESEAIECLKQLAAIRGEKGCDSDSDSGSGAGLMSVIEERIPAVAAYIRRVSIIGRQGGPAKLLEELDRDRRWLEGFPDSNTRLRVLRNVQRALSLAREFQKGDSSSLASFADWMDRAWSKEMQKDEAPWTADAGELEGGNAVRLMTIHASKGLEFPVVVIFDALGKSNKSVIRPSQSLGVAFPKLPRDFQEFQEQEQGTLHFVLDDFLTKQRENDEDMRLFYVAATRARDSLVLCGLTNGLNKSGEVTLPKDCWVTRVIDWLKSSRENECDENLNGPNILRVCPELEPELELEARPVALEPDETETGNISMAASNQTIALSQAVIHSELRPELRLESLSATSFALFEWCPLAWRRRYRQGLDLSWRMPPVQGASVNLDLDEIAELDTLDEGGRGGANLGSLVHCLLSRWNPRRVQNEPFEKFLERWLVPDLPECDMLENRRKLPSYLRDVYQNAKNRGTLWDWLKIFADSKAGALFHEGLLAAGQQEQRFNLDIGGTVISGAIDIVWRETKAKSDLWNVLDYKITSLKHTPTELYDSQLDFYALAVRESARLTSTPCSAVDVRLVFLRDKSRIEQRRVNHWESIRERILTAAREAAQGLYPARREHCSGCPWRMSCAIV